MNSWKKSILSLSYFISLLMPFIQRISTWPTPVQKDKKRFNKWSSIIGLLMTTIKTTGKNTTLGILAKASKHCRRSVKIQLVNTHTVLERSLKEAHSAWISNWFWSLKDKFKPFFHSCFNNHSKCNFNNFLKVDLAGQVYIYHGSSLIYTSKLDKRAQVYTKPIWLKCP